MLIWLIAGTILFFTWAPLDNFILSSMKNDWFCGFISGFAGILIGANGPLVSAYMRTKEISPEVLIANHGAVMIFQHSIKIILFVYFFSFYFKQYLFFIFIFDKIRIPAALLSGTLFASGLLQITDIASYKLPDQSINFCLLILGASVGCRFAEKTVKEIANNSLHSVVATTILVLLGLVAAYIATFFVDTNILTLILSFSPGGIYEVAVIAIAFDLDPDFVAFHHIIRLLFILFTVPIILRVLEKIKK